MVFRPVVVAVKAAVMNLLSITAAYGVLVAVGQWGWLHRLFGFPETVPLPAVTVGDAPAAPASEPAMTRH